MKLPLPLDMEPMLSAISESGIPKGDSWEYEPKWDGFRTLVYRDGAEVALMSRGGRPMTRYFPELMGPFQALREPRLVLDGEIVVVGANGLDFGALQLRVHPAESRVKMLSEVTPAWFIAFDLLAEGKEDLRKLPLGERRKRLEKLLKGVKKPIFLTPYTRDPKTAEDWFEKFEGAGLDRSEEHTSELQSPVHLVCRLLLEKKTYSLWELTDCMNGIFTSTMSSTKS